MTVIETILAGLGITSVTGAAAVIGYFLKQQNHKIDSFDDRISDMKDSLTKEIQMATKDMSHMFQDICHERQGACARIVELKVNGLKAKGEHICSKIEAIKQDREKKWIKQEVVNDKMNGYIARHDK